MLDCPVSLFYQSIKAGKRKANKMNEITVEALRTLSGYLNNELMVDIQELTEDEEMILEVVKELIENILMAPKIISL